MKEMNYSRITTRFVFLEFYTSYYSLDINVLHHFRTLFIRFCSIDDFYFR